MRNKTAPLRTRTPAKGKRLSKDQWLEKAIRLLEKKGPPAMTIDKLTSGIGVTTGSFYHHFKSHGKFLDELTDKYIHDYTYVISETLSTLELPPRELLIAAMRQIITAGLGGMDVHFRALAISYPRIMKKITAMDAFRTDVISQMYESMGYRGDELSMRVHVFVVLQSMESAVNTNLSQAERLRLFDERVSLLID